MILFGKSFEDQNGIRFRGENSTSKNVFIKSSLLFDLINLSIVKKGKSIVSSVAIEGKFVIEQSIATEQLTMSFV